MVVYRAAWVLPIISRPIRQGWLLVQDGRVRACGGGEAPRAERSIHLGDVALMPGLVNAHTHLELSWLRGRVPPGPGGITAWVRRTLAERRAGGRNDPIGIAAGIAEARAAGTTLVGDVANSLDTVPLLKGSPLSAVVFRELLGFAVQGSDAEAMAREAMREIDASADHRRVRGTIAPHAPYSVSPDLFRATAAEVGARGARTSVHVAESPDEIEFLATGGGPWRGLLEELGAWTPRWAPPRCRPLEYLDRLGIVHDRTLLVHAVHLSEGELALAADRGATIVACPRSNRWIGVGAPPVDRFYAAGARVAVGTDSLASAPDSNVFGELAELRRLAPGVPASRLLESATRVGAEALGFGGELGTLAAGSRAETIAVSVPRGVGDVEEYLVGGITPQQITWVAA